MRRSNARHISKELSKVARSLTGSLASSSSYSSNEMKSGFHGRWNGFVSFSKRFELNEDRDGRGLSEEIIEESLDRKTGEKQKKDDAHVARALLTTRNESLSLYRAVIRASVLFVWKDTNGRIWKDVIRESARNEFENGKHERDPEMVNRLILSGREAVEIALDKFMEQRKKIMDKDGDKPSS